MTTLSRRHFLAATAGAAALAALPARRTLAAEAPFLLTVERRTLDVLGRGASIFGLTNAAGSSGLTLDPGQRFRVALESRIDEPTLIHWHGQTPPQAQDGVPDLSQAPLLPGGRYDYDFAPRPGTHWMHSHHGLQEQLLMAAPLIVHTEDDARADEREVVVLLHDFTFRDPAEVLASLTNGAGGHGGHVMPSAIQPMMESMGGMGGIVGLGGFVAGGAEPQPGHSLHVMMGDGPVHDPNDVEYDAYLANDRTLDDPQVVPVDKGGRVRLRLINGATSTAFLIDLGSLDGQVVAVDGNPVAPVDGRRFPLTMGQRLDVRVTLPAEGGAFPILALREGARQRAGIILATPGATVAKVPILGEDRQGALDFGLENRLRALSPLREKLVDRRHDIMLAGSMNPYVWSIDDRTWGKHRPLAVKAGERVMVVIHNPSDMAHPMHLHGHHFQVVALNEAAVPGAVRDTLHLPARSMAAVVFDADNPGRWPLHCHNLLHMATGMMTEVVYET